MFSFHCPTCESKLIVKDETLIGQILNCPKCGGMVLVQHDHSSQKMPSQPAVRKRFPDVLSQEHASGIIGPISDSERRTDIFLNEEFEPDADNNTEKIEVPETEIKIRQFLIGILTGLSILLLIVFGSLIVFRNPEPQDIVQEPLAVQPPALPQVGDTEILPPAINEPETQEINEPDSTESVTEPCHDNHDDVTDATPNIEEMIENPTPLESGNEAEKSEQDNTIPATPDEVEYTLPDIDINAKLALPILEWNLQRCRLIDFIRSISSMTDIPMTLDIDALKACSLSIASPVDGSLRETTAGQVLTEVLDSLELEWSAQDKQILIVPKDTGVKEDWIFDVSDFAEKTDDLRPEVLADRIQKLIYPQAVIEILPDGRLSVAQHEGVQKSSQRTHHEILRFLEQLRVVRRLPQKTGMTGEQLAPEAFGWDEVMEMFTLNYYLPIPLSQVVTQIEANSPLTIIIDHQSLHRLGISYASIPSMVRSDQRTLHDTMELLLASVDTASLAYRIIDHQTLEITTAESTALPEKMSVEVHRYQLPEGETPESFLRSLKTSIAPESWATEETGGKSGGTIVMDEPSGCLFVRQSQPTQRRIRFYLSATEP